MDINITKSIINNFKDSNAEEIEIAINENMEDEEELALPGLGVFFKLLWKSADEKLRKDVVEKIKENLN